MRAPFAFWLATILLSGCSLKPLKKPSTQTNTATTYALTEQQIGALALEADAGAPEAAMRLYRHYNFKARDDEKSLHYLRKAAESGDGVAQFNLAALLTNRADIRDLAQAEMWLNRAERNGGADDEDFPDLISNLRKRIHEIRHQTQGK